MSSGAVETGSSRANDKDAVQPARIVYPELPHSLPCSTTLQVNSEDSYKTIYDHNDLTCCFAIFISTKEALRLHVVQMRSSHDASQYQRY